MNPLSKEYFLICMRRYFAPLSWVLAAIFLFEEAIWDWTAKKMERLGAYAAALFARIFNLIRPAVMQISWFKRLYDLVMSYRNKIHAYLEQWETYQNFKLKIKTIIASWKTKASEEA